ncbi:PEP-CTERM putative exosortase interaction domain-containing protein [Opitutaceae bacterium TAV1]|nr:PEP-CTERM putative exosortase interaction domain-containing protein [Opitutaceae bacterium TAV1]
MKSQSLRSGAMLLIACILTLSIRAAVVIEDTFTGRYSSEESVKLTGTSPDTAGTSLTWSASGNLVFKQDTTSGTDYLTADGSASHANMVLPFSYSLYSSEGSIVTVGITLSSSSSGSNDKWFGVGFSSSTSFNPNSNGSVWLQISRRSTTTSWYLKSKTTTLASGSLDGIDLSASNTFSFSYDFATNTVTGVYLNGTNVLADAYAFSAAPGISSVGAFFQWADSDINKITDFAVSISAVPEPGSWALIGGTLLLGFGIVRRFVKRQKLSA